MRYAYIFGLLICLASGVVIADARETPSPYQRQVLFEAMMHNGKARELKPLTPAQDPAPEPVATANPTPLMPTEPQPEAQTDAIASPETIVPQKPAGYEQRQYRPKATLPAYYRDIIARAKQDDPEATYQLGMLFTEKTEDAFYSPEKSFYWFSRSARLGHGRAQYNLGVMYARGVGTAQNLMEAYVWFNLAAAQGTPNAARARDSIAADLPRSAVIEAQQRSTAYSNTIAKNARAYAKKK